MTCGVGKCFIFERHVVLKQEEAGMLEKKKGKEPPNQVHIQLVAAALVKGKCAEQ